MMTTDRSQFLTIVSGLPRSGTSMMMQMLVKGGIEALTDNIRVADEDNPKGYYEFEPVKKTKDDASWLTNASGKVVKMVHVLLMDLPDDHEYRVVMMRRHMDEIVKSQNIMLDRNQKGGGDMDPEIIKKVFSQQLDKVYQWVESHPNFQMLEVWYNEMLKEPGPIIEKIDAFVGGGLDREAMGAVVDPTLYRNRAT